MGDTDSEVAVQVAGLADSVSDAVLMNVFRPYGAVVRVKRDAFNGAHVIFKSKTAANKAIKGTHGATVEGKAIWVKLVPKFTKTSRPCRGFQAGICRKGEACKYLHLTPDEVAESKELTAPPKIKVAASKVPAAVAAPAVVATDVSNIPSSVVCRHFARGFCSLGATCKFAHVVGGAALPTPAVNPAALVKTRPCAYFASGVCTRGDQCTYLHETSATAPVPAKPMTENAPTKKTAATPAVSKKQQQQQVEESESGSDDEDEEDEAQDDERTCIECEESGVARWKCANCDNALYCDACDAAAHHAKVMAKHKRSLLPPPVEKKPKCGECEDATADVKCEQCEVDYCASCDASVHKFKSLRSHVRTSIGSASGAQKKTEKTDKKDKKDKKVVKAVVEEEKAVAIAPASASAMTPSWSAKEEARQFVESVPKYDLSSDSDSDSDDDEDSDKEEEVAAVFSSSSAPSRSVVGAAKKPASVQPAEISSESSEDEDDDEEKQAAVQPSKPKPSPTATAKVSNDEDASSESDFDDVKPAHLTAVQAKANALAAPAAPSSSSSSSSSSESETESEDKAMPAAIAPAPAARPATKKPLPTPPANRKPGISTGSSHTLVKKIEGYYESDSTEALHLDANLNGFERLLAHDCAERLGLEHVSVGEGLERHITISKPGSQSAGSKRASEAVRAGGKRRKANQ